MLRLLGIAQVRLLTNNPAKVEGLARQGAEVVERVRAMPDDGEMAHMAKVAKSTKPYIDSP